MKKMTKLAILAALVLCAGRTAAQRQAFKVEQTLGASYNIEAVTSMGVGIRYTIAWKWLRLAPHARFMWEQISNSVSNYRGGSSDWDQESSTKFFGADLQLVFFHARTFSVYPFVSYEKMFYKSLETMQYYGAPVSENSVASCTGGGLGFGCNFSSDLAGYIEFRVLGYGYEKATAAATAGLALRF